MNSARSIRVNLRFGPRTDPALLREIAALPPYKRAKRLRQLLEAGWRNRREKPSAVLPKADAGAAEGGMLEAAGGSFSEDLLALVGKSVRL